MDNKSLVLLYENMVDVIKRIEDMNIQGKKDKGLLVVAKNLIKKLYSVSYEYTITDVWVEIKKIEELINGEVGEEDRDILFECLLKCRKSIEENVLRKKSIAIYSRNIKEFSGVIKLLTEEGFNVITEKDEANFLYAITMSNTKIVIIDSDENENGLTLYKMMQDDGTVDGTLVIFTGIQSESLKLKALSLGAIDYIPKPLNDDEIIYKIRNYKKLWKIFIKSSMHDTLTGTYSRRFGEEMARKKVEEAAGKKEKCTVMLIDMDNLAQINISHGRVKGNQMLMDFAGVLKKYISKGDILYRSSGDEFVIIFNNKGTKEAYEIGLKVKNELSSFSENYDYKISFTAGIAAINGDKNFDGIMKLATEAVIKGKNDGKNIIYIHPENLEKADKRSILLVDDDRVILSILSTRYKNKGYEVLSAENPDKAMDIFKNNNIDLIITDYFMPGMNGTEFIRLIRAENLKVPIIMLSAQKTETFMDSALKAGADEYLVKPFSPVELDLRIEKMIS